MNTSFRRNGAAKEAEVTIYTPGSAKATEFDDYLTISEVAVRLRIKPKTVKNKMAAGIFKKGVHYFSPAGLGPRFKWSAIIAWLECEQMPKSEESIPMARGYKLGGTSSRTSTRLTRPDVMSI